MREDMQSFVTSILEQLKFVIFCPRFKNIVYKRNVLMLMIKLTKRKKLLLVIVWTYKKTQLQRNICEKKTNILGVA